MKPGKVEKLKGTREPAVREPGPEPVGQIPRPAEKKSRELLR